MDMYRIEAEWVDGRTSAPGETLELIAGFTPLGFIAQGRWFGVVSSYQECFPFVLSDDGSCAYSGDKRDDRTFSIVTRPVKVGEIFELTWDDNNDRHCYKVTKVLRLNIHPDFPEEQAGLGIPDGSVRVGDDPDVGERASVFVKTDLIRDLKRPAEVKATLASLIDAGNALAVGKDRIDRVFLTGAAFADWFDSQQK